MKASQLCAAALAAAALTLTLPLATGAVPTVLAQAPAAYSASVVDTSGVLSADQVAELREHINDSGRPLLIVLQPSFDGVPVERWADEALARNGGDSMVVLAVATQDRQFGISGGKQWSSSQLDRLYDATRQGLAEGYFEGASAFVNTATGRSSTSIPWAGLLIVLGGASLLIGGGIWWARRRSRDRNAATLADARRIDPHDVAKLGALPTPILASLADDYVIDTDEAVRTAEEELNLARAEFGSERTRSFQQSLDRARAALHRANDTHLRLTDAIPESEPTRRGMLIDVISDAGAARAELHQRSEEFVEMRDLLWHSDSAIEQLTRTTVDLTRRLPLAATTLENLRQTYQPAALTTIQDNIDLARASLTEAERGLSEASRLAGLPAGEQGALVGILRGAEHAAAIADKNLAAIEHAEANISTARANLPALIDEVAGEIPLVEEPTLCDEATTALAAARSQGNADPLTHIQRLSELDARLDAAIAQRHDRDRAEALLNQQIAAATTAVQAAEDFIAARGRIVGAPARTALSQAKSLLAHRDLDSARQATERAQQAQRLAHEDVTRQRNDQIGSLITGVLLGAMLGGRGGSNGGGGGFRGGSF